MKCTYTIHSGHEPPRTVVATGKRLNMILSELITAGNNGITSITYPGVRVADSIFKARGLGFTIDTQYEAHSGPFSGRHARYRLVGRVSPVVTAPLSHHQTSATGDEAASVNQVPA